MALFWKGHSLLCYKKFSCLKDKKPNQEKWVPITNKVTQEQFELILTDYLHLNKSKGERRGEGSEYLLTVVDHFTKYVPAFPTKKKQIK